MFPKHRHKNIITEKLFSQIFSVGLLGIILSALFSCMLYYHAFSVRVELNDTPRVAPGDVRRVRLTFFCNPRVVESRKLQLRLLLPAGFSVDRYERTVSLLYAQPLHGLWGNVSTDFNIHVEAFTEAVNRIYAEITCPTLPYPVMVPIIFIG